MLFKKVRLFLRISYTKNGQVTVKTSALDHAAWSSLGKEYIESDSVHSGDDGKGLHVHFPARPTSVRRGCWKLSKLRGERGRDVFCAMILVFVPVSNSQHPGVVNTRTTRRGVTVRGTGNSTQGGKINMANSSPIQSRYSRNSRWIRRIARRGIYPHCACTGNPGLPRIAALGKITMEHRP